MNEKKENIEKEVPAEAETVLTDKMVVIFNRLQNDLDCVYSELLNCQGGDREMRKLLFGELEKLLGRVPVYCARYMAGALSVHG